MSLKAKKRNKEKRRSEIHKYSIVGGHYISQDARIYVDHVCMIKKVLLYTYVYCCTDQVSVGLLKADQCC